MLHLAKAPDFAFQALLGVITNPSVEQMHRSFSGEDLWVP